MKTIAPSSFAFMVLAVANLTDGATISGTTIVTKVMTYTNYEEYSYSMLAAVNKQRATEGLSPLCLNNKLHMSAQSHSDDMAAHDYMGHVGSDGSTMSDRITQTTYEWEAVAENVAAGQVDVDEVMIAWINSPEHLVNIMGNYTMFASAYSFNKDGVYGDYWTQNFGLSETESCDEIETPAVPQITPTVEQVTPMVEQVTPTVEDVTPTVEQVTPTVEQVTPMVEQVTPIVEQVTPTVEQLTPMEEQTKPAPEVLPTAEQVNPTVPENLIAVEQVTPIEEQVTPTVEQLTPMVEQANPAPEVLPTAEQLNPTVPENLLAVEQVLPPVSEILPYLEQATTTVPDFTQEVEQAISTNPEDLPAVEQVIPPVPDVLPAVEQVTPTAPEILPAVEQTTPTVPDVTSTMKQVQSDCDSTFSVTNAPAYEALTPPAPVNPKEDGCD
ncbi:CAP domain [Plasmopara halstedii]|uniref:CAP domain n=1 Tax=Plasmopara halstedii TaxID=4781 RepID=A0A0P1AH64_PLAHL|nr:CAP domain [Plasmopara halstedii]CEG40143.1 CAP domain [Plasmopara halstedii]|eukprot:XP_024576512.1 CAP domain [Plasmopara halstedii]